MYSYILEISTRWFYSPSLLHPTQGEFNCTFILSLHMTLYPQPYIHGTLYPSNISSNITSCFFVSTTICILYSPISLAVSLFLVLSTCPFHISIDSPSEFPLLYSQLSSAISHHYTLTYLLSFANFSYTIQYRVVLSDYNIVTCHIHRKCITIVSHVYRLVQSSWSVNDEWS